MALSERQPTLSAMLICERVIREAETGLVSLIGVFEGVQSPQRPTVVPALWVYAKITDAQGEYEFRLDIVRRNDEQQIAQAAIPGLRLDDPLQPGEVIIQLGGLKFEEAGHYDFRLYANGRFVGTKSLLVQFRQGENA
jgi:Family of unknown function (DUF6941)